MKRTHLSAAIALACFMSTGVVMAQSAADQSAAAQTTTTKPEQRASASSTSNTTTSNDTKRVQQLSTVQVQAQSLSLGGGLMSVQTAPKAVSTITRDAIEKASPGSNFTQMISTIPGVNSATDDVTGLANGHYSMRGYDSSDIGMTVNGAPITDTGSYSVYATEYGDSENMGDITVLQGIPDIDMPDGGASGGHIGWATIDPSHQAGVDFTQSVGSNDYRRTFLRLNTGDTGPVRSWLSYSDNTADMWRSPGTLDVSKVDGKSIWTIDDNNSISASLQYSRQSNFEYETVSKSQVAQDGYYTGYNPGWIPLAGLSGTKLKSAATTDESYYGLHTNPYRSYVFSMDGEFKLSDSLHLSVIPYFEYGNGGGGGGALAQESNSPTDKYLYANIDLNGNGTVTNSTKTNFSGGTVYSYSSALTYRPGVVFKFNQDFGLNNSLEYGFWYERSRKSQADTYGLLDPQTGTPDDVWSNSSYLLYPNGLPQKYYDEYTNTETKKGFVTDNWTPNDQWTLTAGVSYLFANRTGFSYDYPGSTTQVYDSFDNNWHKFLPMAGIKFQLDDHNQFYIGSGKTFRVPSNTVAILDVLSGVANSNPETSWNTDLGWRYYGDAISASADIYHSNYFNKQEAAYDQNGNEYYTTIPHMDMQGFNSEASWKFAPNWTVYTSYTYTQAKIVGNLDGGLGNQNNDALLAEGIPAIYLTNGRTMPDTARNIGNLSLGYDDSHLWATLNARATSSLYGDYMNTEKVGGFTTLNFSGGYRFGDWDWLKKPYIKLNVDNLADRRAFSYVGSAQLLATSAAAQYPSLYASTPYYGLLQPRAYVVTFGASFF